MAFVACLCQSHPVCSNGVGLIVCFPQVRGSSGKPLLECAYRQAFALVEELKRTGVPAALVLDVASLCRMNAG